MKETHTPQDRLLLNVAPLRHVQTVQELSDILVADFADLLNVGGALGDVLEALSKCQCCILRAGKKVCLRFRRVVAHPWCSLMPQC
jgi:hypothetical protein